VRIEVSFTPAALPKPEGKVCIVIDALRATSTLATMFASGLEAALVVGSLAAARRAATRRRSWLLCGEKRSLPPKGFDYGNSPVFVTTNGTRALMRAAGCSAVFAGSMLNLSAVVRAAEREAARDDQALLIHCAGDLGGRAFDLEDAFCAGAMVDQLISRRKAFELNDEAEAARRLYQSYGGYANDAFRQARHGVGLTRVGLGADVEFCAQRDRYRVVPKLERTRSGLLLRVAATRRGRA
jgi:2-phosphosulfolactate phosphatase